MRKLRYRKGVACWDLHYPEHSDPAFRVFMDFLSDFKPYYLVLGGDQLDMNSLSFFNRGKPKLLEGQRIVDEYLGFQSEVLSPIEGVLPRSHEKFFLLGNHEYRVDRYLESYPQLTGIIEPERNLDLRGWSVIPFNDSVELGHMTFIHGFYWNKYFSNRTLLEYGSNVFFGHVHSNQVFTKTTPMGNDPKQGVGVGCLCDVNPHWKRGRPNHWLHQFLFFYLFEDGSFTYYTPIIVNGRCVINDVLYDGNVV